MQGGAYKHKYILINQCRSNLKEKMHDIHMTRKTIIFKTMNLNSIEKITISLKKHQLYKIIFFFNQIEMYTCHRVNAIEQQFCNTVSTSNIRHTLIKK